MLFKYGKYIVPDWAIEQLCYGEKKKYSTDPSVQKMVTDMINNFRNQFGDDAQFSQYSSEMVVTNDNDILSGVDCRCYSVVAYVPIELSAMNSPISEPVADDVELLDLYVKILEHTPEFKDFDISTVVTYEDIQKEIERAENLLNDIAPKGYWFGEHPDRKTEYGFWKDLKLDTVLT